MELQDGLKSSRETWYFLDWMEKFVVGNEAIRREVDDLFQEVAAKVGAVKRFRNTPQSAPWHCEGITVDVHVKRMLGTIQAVVQGADLLTIEEFSREKTLHEGLVELQEVIREHAGFFLAYAFVHDIAKPDVVFLEALPGSKGAKEGFVEARRKGLGDVEQIQHYFKLFKSFLVKHEGSEVPESMANFFDEYEIQVHYYNHDRVGSGDSFASVREVIASQFRVSADHVDSLRLLTKRHMQTMSFFLNGVNVEKYDFLAQQAGRDGYDADDYLDLALGCLFLDVTAGSLAYEHGQFSAQYQPVLNCLRSELMAREERKHRRSKKREEAFRRRRKQVLEEVGLAGDVLFSLLNVPFGPGRADVVQKISDAVDGRGDLRGFSSHVDELQKRVDQARALLRE